MTKGWVFLSLVSERATGTPSHLSHFTGFLKDASKNIGFETDEEKNKIITSMLGDKMVNNSVTGLGGQGGPTTQGDRQEAGSRWGGCPRPARTTEWQGDGREEAALFPMGPPSRDTCSPNGSPYAPGMAGSEGCGMDPGWCSIDSGERWRSRRKQGQEFAESCGSP